MTLNEYQQDALKTAIYPSGYGVVYPVLGLTGEAGEVADKIKKIIRDNGGRFSEECHRRAIACELGDVMWYIAALAHELGYSLEEIASLNIQKLKDRRSRNKLGGSGDNR